ncbi:non-hydrolyzing UDP-N-acetylglucosamine 2-epimerase [candidate division CSSED10-310 bacterium]|uniref:UDP-N-acetylglucosamine 2-epimerase (non-hydrolyzing) n=1 Tax=candidate division CSSED10-310 bacterium TaxID=2855610 RepID=A0ABV6Z0N9_UNCC1
MSVTQSPQEGKKISTPQKILIIAGTRPEVIKLAPVIRELEKYPHHFKPHVIVTGQHRELLDQMLSSLRIEPDEDFKVMEENQALGILSAKVLTHCHHLLARIQPALVMVQGDTASAFCAALSAYYFQIPIGHVEAGLRTFNKYHPFPEEGMRILIDSISDFCWTPTHVGAQNLKQEGIADHKLFITGNTVIDALHLVLHQTKNVVSQNLKAIDFSKKIILVTVHRRENWGDNVQAIFRALITLAAQHQDVEIIYPVHFSPTVRNMAYSMLQGVRGIHLVEPLDYISFVHLLARSTFVMTDSGGIQEEAPALGKPVLVLREVTERPEGVTAGTAKVVGLASDQILNEAEKLLTDPKEYNSMANAVNPYGDGNSAKRIVQCLRHHFFHDCARPEPFTTNQS